VKEVGGFFLRTPRNEANKWLWFSLVSFLWPVSLQGDTLDINNFTTSLQVGESTTIKKTVTVSQGGPTTAKIDVFFFCDPIGLWKWSLTSIWGRATAAAA
jgi:hypothetical protein